MSIYGISISVFQRYTTLANIVKTKQYHSIGEIYPNLNVLFVREILFSFGVPTVGTLLDFYNLYLVLPKELTET